MGNRVSKSMSSVHMPLAAPGLPQRTHIAVQMASERAASMIVVLEHMALDTTLNSAVRRLCANDVLAYGIGRPAVSVQVSAAPDGNDEAGLIIDGQIEQAQASADAMRRVLEYAGKVPWEMWPEDAKAAMGYSLESDG